MTILKKILVQNEQPEYTGVVWAKLVGNSINLYIYRGNQWVSISSSQLSPEQLNIIKSFISTEITAADINAVSLDQKGTINGVASLDSTGKVPASQLPNPTNVDNIPISGSKNLITSGGVYTALQNVEIDIDASLSSTSKNPVQNQVVKSALDQINNILANSVFIGDIVGEVE